MERGKRCARGRGISGSAAEEEVMVVVVVVAMMKTTMMPRTGRFVREAAVWMAEFERRPLFQAVRLSPRLTAADWILCLLDPRHKGRSWGESSNGDDDDDDRLVFFPSVV
jgi:hypothetical protein